jgi:hypothetical protein
MHDVRGYAPNGVSLIGDARAAGAIAPRSEEYGDTSQSIEYENLKILISHSADVT